MTITVTVADDGGTANAGVDTFAQPFTVDVDPVNDSPSFDPIANQTPDEGAGPQMLTITGITAGDGLGEAGQTVTLTAMSSDPAIVPTPTITDTGMTGTRTLIYAPLADGTTIISVAAEALAPSLPGACFTLPSRKR